MSQNVGLAHSGSQQMNQVEIVTVDIHEFLEDSESRRTNEWLSIQRQNLHTALCRHPERTSIKELVIGVLATAALDIPLSAADRSVFSYRSVSEALPNCCLRSGSNGRLSVLAASTEYNGQHRTPYPLAISTDGERAAIGWRTDCRDELDLQIVELESRRVVADVLPSFETHRTVWDSDLRGYWYVRAAPPNVELLYQSISAPAAEPVTLQYCLPAEQPKDVCLHRFPESNWLLLAIRSRKARCAFDYYILSRDAGSALRLLWREWPHKASFSALGDRLFVLTDWGAPNRRVLRINLANSDESKVEVLIPEGTEPVTSLHLAGESLLLRTAATPWTTRLQAYTLDGTPLEIEGLPTDGTIEAVGVGAAEPYVYVEESGICRKPTIHRLDTRTGKATPYFQSFSRINLPQIETITTWYMSIDGVRVPVRLSRRKDLSDGVPRPTILTTYGGFGVIDTMRYTNRSALWLSLGGVYVDAGVRGGGELGAEWHRAGMLHEKQTTFSDFIAAAEWLVEQGYTTPSKLAIVGGSNAGLVVSVAMTMRPDLFAAVVCSGPLLDMLRFHKFAGGAVGMPEFGSPENPEDEAVLRRYSPYHNVRTGMDYPPVLFVSGDADTRCDPMHVRKMVALMQATNPSGRPVLLDYRPNKGHSGLMPLPDRIDTLTNQFVFLVDALGLHVNDRGQFDYYRKEAKTPA